MCPKNSPRYVRINIIKVVDFYTEKYKFSNILPKFLKEITKVLHNLKYILCSFIRRQCFYSSKRLLSVPLTAKRSNQSILKEINLEYSLEGLKVKFQYSGHLMRRADSLEKTVMLGKIEGGRRGRQRMRRLDGTTDSVDRSRSQVLEVVRDREAWRAAVHEVAKSRTWLSD